MPASLLQAALRFSLDPMLAPLAMASGFLQTHLLNLDDHSVQSLESGYIHTVAHAEESFHSFVLQVSIIMPQMKPKLG